MSGRRTPSSALTSFVVASRYLPVYIAIGLLVVVAWIWAPATLTGAAFGAPPGFAAAGFDAAGVDAPPHWQKRPASGHAWKLEPANRARPVTHPATINNGRTPKTSPENMLYTPLACRRF
jgi:hypothetical protein